MAATIAREMRSDETRSVLVEARHVCAEIMTMKVQWAKIPPKGPRASMTLTVDVAFKNPDQRSAFQDEIQPRGLKQSRAFEFAGPRI